jgi:FAD/FMN-containing dehydrogenase
MNRISRRDLLKAGAIAGLGIVAYPYRIVAATLDYQLLDASSMLYPSLTQSYNRRSQGAPRYIARCFTSEGVRLALELALRDGLTPVTVRAGGHCFEDFVTSNRGGLLIDVSPLSAINRNSSGVYQIGAGCTLGNIYSQLDSLWGAVIPGGSCPSVGIAGHALGGGYGFLSNRHGLVADYLTGIELVTINERGQVNKGYFDASTTEGANVLWAHQGGGGQFGIVTRLDFAELPARPARIAIGRLEWRWSDLNLSRFSALLQAFTRYCEANKSVTAEGGKLFASLRITHVSSGNLRLNVVSSDSNASDLKVLLDRMLNAAGIRARTGSRLSSTSKLAYTANGIPYEIVSWKDCVSIFGGANPTTRSKQKSAFVRRALSDPHIKVLYKYLREDTAVRGNASFDIASFGGAINSRAVSSSAFRERRAAMRILTQVYWPDQVHDALNIDWSRRFHGELFANQGGEPLPSYYWGGSYINYPDRDLVNYKLLYYGLNLKRLISIKRKLDPLHFFKHPQGCVG